MKKGFSSQDEKVLAFYPSNCYLSNSYFEPYIARDGIRYLCTQQAFSNGKG